MSIRCASLAVAAALGLCVISAADEPGLKLAGSAPAKNSLIEELLAAPPGLLKSVDEDRQVLAGKLRAEVERSLQSARMVLSQNPGQAEQDLKLTVERIEGLPRLDPELRGQLRRQVQDAIRQARQKKVEADQQAAANQERRATALEQEHLTGALSLEEQRLKQIVDRFSSL